MIAYEVKVLLRGAGEPEFETYMRDEHIPEVLATGSFVGASFESSGPGSYRTRYLAPDRAALDDYLKHHAPRLRDDFAARFTDGVTVEREEWTVIATFA